MKSIFWPHSQLCARLADPFFTIFDVPMVHVPTKLPRDTSIGQRVPPEKYWRPSGQVLWSWCRALAHAQPFPKLCQRRNGFQIGWIRLWSLWSSLMARNSQLYRVLWHDYRVQASNSKPGHRLDNSLLDVTCWRASESKLASLQDPVFPRRSWWSQAPPVWWLSDAMMSFWANGGHKDT